MHVLAVVFILLETICLAPCIYFKPLFCYILLYIFCYIYNRIWYSVMYIMNIHLMSDI